jgi:hypothetical protein
VAPAPPADPDSSWLKADIVAWLVGAGWDEKALDGLTKPALLALVGQPIPGPDDGTVTP